MAKATTDFKWEFLLTNGSVIEGEGGEKNLVKAMKYYDGAIEDGDVWYVGRRYNVTSWNFLLKRGA